MWKTCRVKDDVTLHFFLVMRYPFYQRSRLQSSMFAFLLGQTKLSGSLLSRRGLEVPNAVRSVGNRMTPPLSAYR
jgi:hypothetical protein